MSLLRFSSPRLWIIGILAMLPLAALAGPSNAAAVTGTHATYSTHAHRDSVMPGPVRGLHFHHRTMPHGTPSASSFVGSSSNWAGYVVNNLSQTTTASFNKVSATWTVSAVTCDPNPSDTEMAADWVGLDGFGNGTVEQGGSMAECLNGSPSYYAWWEMYPYNGTQNQFAVNAGDVIHSTVSYDPSTSQFDIVVNDETSNQTINQDIACQASEPACDRSSAEVISEAPCCGGDYDNLLLLPDYGTQAFTDASVTDVNGHTGSLNDAAWNNYQLSQVSSENVTQQTVSPLSTDGTSFATTWQAESGRAHVLANGGFETGNDIPWVCWADDAVVTSPVHSGTYAVQITPTGSQAGECDQWLALSPNTSYTLTGWFQGSGQLGVSGDATASQSTASSTWTKLTVPFTTGSSGDVTIYIRGQFDAANAYADDISLTG